MTTLQVFSAVTGDLILQTELPEEEIFLHLSDRICAATGVPNFCQQLMSQDGDIIRDWKAWDQLGQPLNLQVAFQMATKSLSHELLEFSSTGDHDKVQEILQQFQDPNVVDPAGESPMVKVRGHFFEAISVLFVFPVVGLTPLSSTEWRLREGTADQPQGQHNGIKERS